MAEIPIQRKPRRRLWPLLLLLIVILVAAWYFWSQRAPSVPATPADTTAPARTSLRLPPADPFAMRDAGAPLGRAA